MPKDFKLNAQVTEITLPAGRYAVTIHKGSRDNIGDTIYSIYRDCLPQSGEELGDLPCIFCYYNFDYEIAETESLPEIWVSMLYEYWGAAPQYSSKIFVKCWKWLVFTQACLHKTPINVNLMYAEK